MTDKGYDPYYASDGSVKCESLRDMFAAKAMQGDWAAQSNEVGYFSPQSTDEQLNNGAELYYRMADAILRAREK